MIDTSQMDMVGRIGHEVGNAVTVIKCSLNIMKNKTPELEKTAFFSIALDEVDYMEKLMKDIMDYKNSTRINLQCENISLFTKECVDNIIKIQEHLGKKVKINLTSDNWNQYVMIDKIKYKEIILNLVKNSIEAIALSSNQDGFINIRINRSGEREDINGIKIEIEDNGCGINEKNIDNIFNPMVTYKQGGTGLGLAIVKEIVEAHRGKIKVISTENVGTTFVINLPIEN